MRVFGELCLLAAFVGSGYAAFACLLSDRARWTHLARRGMVAAIVSWLALTGTLGVLGVALVEKDFRFEYVAHYTSQSLPWHYSLSALWVGQAGSLLLWTWLLALLTLIFVVTIPKESRLRTPAFGILLANVWFLTAIMVFAADPMKASLSPRTEGLGLSPLLQHPSMLIHPPIVFLAYAGWAIPCSLAVAALITGELDARWTQQARPWALFAWTVLGAGLLLGAHWAYQELGWGGYWGWDPVENGSLIPWLTGTASIHSLMVWRHRGSLKKLALSLPIVTFGLCNFATFLTRSGIFSSVHAFSQSPIGWMFLGVMLVLLVGGTSLVFLRRRELLPERPIGSPFSREALVLMSAYLLLLLTAVVVVGTLSVPLSGMIVDHVGQVGPAFYNNALMPIGILLLSATAIVPLARWGAAPNGAQKKALLICMVLSSVCVVVAAWLGVRQIAALAVTGLAVLAVCSLVSGLCLDALRHEADRPFAGVLSALTGHRRQYAGYVIHVALVCLAIGITGSSLGTRRHETELSEGDVIDWAGRRIEYVRLVQRELPDMLVAEVELRVSRGTNAPVTLKPARHLHVLQDEWTTEVAIDSTWSGDFYTILHAGLGDGRVLVTFVENPSMRWIWFGGWLGLAGVLVAAWPERRKRARQGGQYDEALQSRVSAPVRLRKAA